MNFKTGTLNRAVIINPPVQDFYATPHRMSALGMRIVHRIIHAAGFATHFVDGTESAVSRELPLPKELTYLKPHIIPNETGKCSFFTRFHHFGRSYREIADDAAAFDPDLCFIGCFAFCYGRPVIEISQLIRERCPNTVIIAGGAGITAYPDYFLRYSSIDFTLSGEAEVTLAPFLDLLRNQDALPQHLPNLGWKTGPERHFSPIRNSTSAASIHPIIQQNLNDDRHVAFTASISRGCPASCRFCSNHLSHGRQFRHCQIEQFETLLCDFPQTADLPVSINFEDDNLLYDPFFFRQVLEQCRRRFPSVRFTAENGLDYRLMSPELCETLIDLGFSQFNFTLGSTSPTVLDRTGRDNDAARFDDLLSTAARRGIQVISYVICGFSDDMKSSVAENLRYLTHRPTTIGISLFYPVPGIAGFENRTKFDRVPLQRCTGAAAYPWCGSLDTATLVTAFRLARFINLTKSPAPSAEEQILIEKTMLTGKIHTIIKERRKRRIIEVPLQDEELTAMVLAPGNRTV